MYNSEWVLRKGARADLIPGVSSGARPMWYSFFRGGLQEHGGRIKERVAQERVRVVPPAMLMLMVRLLLVLQYGPSPTSMQAI